MEKITKKYEVRNFNVETRWSLREFNASEKWFNQCDQQTYLLKAFDTLEEARKFYNEYKTWIHNHGHYYQHHCKCIEINHYNENGDWVDGGDWVDYEIPEKQ